MKTNEQPNNPLHGVTLAAILDYLTEHYTWEDLFYRVRINCFLENPSKHSSLKFLRKTLWARKRVEELYLYTLENERSKST
ncbi:MAG: hypothetical protein FD143_1727 [Ignavibacteria bacterium]|nr:MAG: hypothetical protein FD143_1727 [Ignavibacteria bacterium]KAF0160075.1 MAG: hypothetical protein FD188_1889 [Ignavibacteria bacterium]